MNFETAGTYDIYRDIPYAERACRGCFDIYLPHGATADTPLLIYFYGGSLKKGSKDRQKLPAALAACGAAVAVPDYRLIPDVSYPAFIGDAADAVGRVLEMNAAGEILPRCGRVFVGGHSAGAYLSMMAYFDRHYFAERGIDAAALSGFLFISGSPVKHMTICAAEGLDPRRVMIDESAALWHVDGDYPTLPLLIVTSDRDLRGRREQNYLLRGTLAHFDYPAPVTFVDLRGIEHGKMCKPDKDGNIPVLPYVADFIGLSFKAEKHE